jgi:hypothetical protein
MPMICPLCHDVMQVGYPFRMVQVRTTGALNDGQDAHQAAHAYECLYLAEGAHVEETIHIAG